MEMQFVLSGMSDEAALLVQSFLRIMNDDYSRADIRRLRVKLDAAQTFLDVADLETSRGLFRRSDVAAAFDNDLRPLFSDDDDD